MSSEHVLANEEFDKKKAEIKGSNDINNNMFKINKLTDKIVEIIIRLYHVNILSILGDEEINPQSIIRNVPFMCGILEDNEGTIYITISEDPREDDRFYDKMNCLINLLLASNIHCSFINDDTELLSKLNMRNMYNPLENVKGKKDIKMFYNIDMSRRIDVKLINSENYLKSRRSGYGFEPFKKYKMVDDKEEISCNNGSTCTESKLFAYLYNINKKWSDIKGFVSYWIGNKIPPNHVIKSYTYDEENDEDTNDNTKLYSLISKNGYNDPYSELNKTTTHSLNYVNDNALKNANKNYNSIMKSIFRPLALPCPGCFRNFEDYSTNRKKRFNFSECNVSKNELHAKLEKIINPKNRLSQGNTIRSQGNTIRSQDNLIRSQGNTIRIHKNNDFFMKYIKYKNKYIALKKSLESNSKLL
jgi:hypothetical protein